MTIELGNAITVGTYGNFDSADVIGNISSIGTYGWFTGDIPFVDRILTLTSLIRQDLIMTSNIRQDLIMVSDIIGGGG